MQMSLAINYLALFFCWVYLSIRTHDLYCLDTDNHKVSPSKQSAEEMGICKSWAKYSCCDNKTAESITFPGDMYMPNVPFSQCPEKKPLSQECKRYFQLDLCFYHCGSMFRPWVVPVSNGTVRKERYLGIPLCASDCDKWFEACKDDYTCAISWYPTSFANISGVPQCINECKTFKEYHNNPKHFCENIFKGSLKYSTSSERCCMQLSPNYLLNNLRCSDQHSKSYAKEGEKIITFMFLAICGCFIVAFFIVYKRRRARYGLHLSGIQLSVVDS